MLKFILSFGLSHIKKLIDFNYLMKKTTVNCLNYMILQKNLWKIKQVNRLNLKTIIISYLFYLKGSPCIIIDNL